MFLVVTTFVAVPPSVASLNSIVSFVPSPTRLIDEKTAPVSPSLIKLAFSILSVLTAVDSFLDPSNSAQRVVPVDVSFSLNSTLSVA